VQRGDEGQDKTGDRMSEGKHDIKEKARDNNNSWEIGASGIRNK
jgi:hypothetical protein